MNICNPILIAFLFLTICYISFINPITKSFDVISKNDENELTKEQIKSIKSLVRNQIIGGLISLILLGYFLAKMYGAPF